MITVLQAIGVGAFALALVAAATVVRRTAGAQGVLLPVAVGGGLRLAVMLAAHVASLLAGDDGFHYLDDRGYSLIGTALADAWRSGDPPSAFEPLGILRHGGPAFYHLAGGLTLLTGDNVIPLKLLNVLLGTVTVLLSALLAGHVIGPRAARRTAWVVALAPTIVWWNAPMLKESLAAALLLGTLYAATRLPRSRALVAAVLLLALLALTRVPIFVAAGCTLCAYAAAHAAIALRRDRRTVARPLAVLAVLAATTAGLAAFVTSWSGGGGDAGGGAIVADSVQSGQEVYGGSFDSPIANRAADAPATEAAASGARFLFSPRAWAFATQPLDWYQPLYPPMWLWYLVLPTAAFGVWRLRRRPEALLVLVPIGVTGAIYAVALASGVRQRSAVEPLLAILVVTGYTTPRALALSGAAALAVVAPVAAVDLGSLPVGLLIGALSAALAVWAWRRPVSTEVPPPAGFTPRRHAAGRG
jgi:hypothetical protein